jgi:peptidoglycan/xylan/chitin deacetylase (PgdA/CDA1 family)
VATKVLGKAVSWDSQGKAIDGPQLLSADEVGRLAQEGVDFGAHGRTHQDLTGLSQGELEDEVHGSRADLEQLTGRSVTTFAYPFGLQDGPTHELVSSEYELAFTTERGINGLSTPPHLLRRSGVGATDSLLDIEWRARTGQRALRRMRDLAGLRRRAHAAKGDRARRS